MTNKITFSKPSFLKEKVNEKRLEHIVIATSDKNQFIPDKNKFIVTKDFLSNTLRLFDWCVSLQSIDFRDFDFSKISTMEGCFIVCRNLTKIIFPEKVDCPNLQNLYNCFSCSGITNLNLSNWHFSKKVNMTRMCWDCRNLVDLKLPQATSYSCKELALDCKNLKTIDFPMTLIYDERKLAHYKEWVHYRMFENCTNLTLLNCEKVKTKHDYHDTKHTFEHSVQNTPEDLIVILPN